MWFLKIYILKAKHGDCFVVDFDNGKCILIDGGFPCTYKVYLKPLLQQLNSEGKTIEFLICTHFDEDHISGLITFLEDYGSVGSEKVIKVENIICNVYDSSFSQPIFNQSGIEEISFQQQKNFEKLCNNIGLALPETEIVSERFFQGKDYKIKIISPSKYDLDQCKIKSTGKETIIPKFEEISATIYEDISQWKGTPVASPLNYSNKASLSFEIYFHDKIFLFCGDANMKDYKGLLQEKYDLIKLSHHGTYHGNECFIGNKPITSNRYIISTNSARFYHPELKLLSGILTQKGSKEIIFNYDLRSLPHRDYYLLKNEKQLQIYNITYTHSNELTIEE